MGGGAVLWDTILGDVVPRQREAALHLRLLQLGLGVDAVALAVLGDGLFQELIHRHEERLPGAGVLLGYGSLGLG